MKMINKKIIIKILISTLISIVGLVLLALIIYSIFGITNIYNILIRLFIYYFILYWVSIYLFVEFLMRNKKYLKFFTSKIFLHLISMIIIIMLLFNFHTYINDDILFAIAFIFSIYIVILSFFYTLNYSKFLEIRDI